MLVSLPTRARFSVSDKAPSREPHGPSAQAAIDPPSMELSGPRRSLVWEPAVEHAEVDPTTLLSAEARLAAEAELGLLEDHEPPPPSDDATTVTTALASAAWMSTPTPPPAGVDRARLRAELRELRRLELERRGQRS